MAFVVSSGSRQYTVAKGQQFIVNSLKDVKEGDVVDLDVVCAYGDDKDAKTIKATVVKHQKGEKIRVVKYKRKVSYHRQYGPRQSETVLQIN